MTHQYVDVHVLQTVPPSNLNRDDTGSPKTALYGGVTRARVSSQAWKRAARTAFARELDTSDLGVRTKRLVEVVLDRLRELAPEVEENELIEAIRKVFAAAKIKLSKPRTEGELDETGYLLFLSNGQIDALAELAREVAVEGVNPQKKAALAIKEKNSIALALFGRMVADVADLNVDAAAQVAHAISVHAVDNEFDFFTAVDDHKAADAEEDAGAGMIGTVEFNSSTLYRYATINVGQLLHNLGDLEAVRRAVRAFVSSFVTSMPTGKQNTFANRTLPDAVIVTIRDDQPANWVGAFETPIVGEGRVAGASQALANYAASVESAFGSNRLQTWVVSVGDSTSALDSLGEPSDFTGMLERLESSVGLDLAGTT